MYRKISLAFFAVAVGLCCALPAFAQKFPDRSVTIVVPQTPGGGNDVLGRAIAAKLAEKWKQPVVIENKGGAAGDIGAAYVARAPNDGYTLMVASDGPMAINVSLYKKLPFDPLKDFTPLASLASFEFVLLVNKASPVNSLADFKALARKRAQAGQPFAMGAVTGSTSHLAGAMIERALGLKSTTIGYKGVSEATVDLMGGRLDWLVLTIASAAGQVKSGALKGVVVTGARKSRLLPNLPTLKESGVPLVISSWFGLFGPANMPPGIVRKIHEDVDSILKDADTRTRMQALGLDVFETSPAKFAETMKSSIDSWGSIVRDTGISMD